MTRRQHLRLVHSQRHRRAARSIAEILDRSAPKTKLELVVDTDGTVESVRLLGRVPSIHDRMFLSVAKAWQFQPAVKNGMTVKYRKTVWIAVQ